MPYREQSTDEALMEKWGPEAVLWRMFVKGELNAILPEALRLSGAAVVVEAADPVAGPGARPETPSL